MTPTLFLMDKNSEICFSSFAFVTQLQGDSDFFSSLLFSTGIDMSRIRTNVLLLSLVTNVKSFFL